MDQKETMRDRINYSSILFDREYLVKEDTFSVAVIGDMHLHCTTPASRLDNYPETCIQKMSILRRELKQRGIKYLFVGGDIFHVAKERSDFEFMVIQEFQKFKQDGITVFMTVGNHDIISDRLDSIEKTSLGILFLTDTVSPFKKVVFQRDGKTDVVFHGCHFPNAPEEVSDFRQYNILVCHKFWNVPSDKDSLLKSDLERLGYNMYICGHDHVVYDPEKVPYNGGAATIIRPGSFMRGSSHQYNTRRLVYFDIIEFNGAVKTHRETLPVKEPAEVFPASAVDRVVETNVKDLTKQLSELVTKMYEMDNSNTSVYQILDESPIDPKVKDRIQSYLEANGIFRKDTVDTID